MNKREADTILLACKKHGISLNMRKEGDVYLVTFMNRIEIKSFEGAKHVTNGLVIEDRCKRELKSRVHNMQSSTKMNFSNYSKKKTRPDNGITLGERHEFTVD